jgi:hypothetical protein
VTATEALLREALAIVSTVAHPERGDDPAEQGPEALKLERRIRAHLRSKKRKVKTSS